MSVELTTKYAPQTDELFKAESKISLLTNTDFDWTGAHAIKLYKISTAPMNDYSRNRSTEPADSEGLSRYGKLLDLSATTEELLLKHDRSFIFNVDRLDEDETAGQLEAGTALARELREVVVPEVDTNVYSVMTTGAGHKPAAAALTKSNIYAAVLAASQALDDAEVPETERVLVVTPASYALLKQAVEFDHTEIGADMRARGVVAMIDGAAVVKVPAIRLPSKFGFMLAHPSATVAPVKLEDFGIHNDTPLSSGTIVTGRVCYDAFVLDNKKTGIYYQATT
ncbi:hypothetical protein [Faecalibacterium prausnitzii]|jgi:hypothetical protein|uniref:N4-gp56 family major capsid protein n=1 Tax=Faecalibacterium prausnitzii TaxID=853 RepID=A0A3E2TZE2_9FIRM|nr:hypothetical protein [Faecalibacterium prausnitzii]RGB88085.1 hypothetical protein DWZ25_05780 [Faecalibacterium prausnitzii]